MAWLQIEKDVSQAEGALIIIFNLGGVALFILSGMLNKKDEGQSTYVLIGAILVRLYTFYHIYCVFEDDQMYSMFAGNVVLIVFELAMYFVHKQSGNRIEQEHENYEFELTEITRFYKDRGVFIRQGEGVLDFIKRIESEREVKPVVQSVPQELTPKERVINAYVSGMTVRALAAAASVSTATAQKYKPLNGVKKQTV